MLAGAGLSGDQPHFDLVPLDRVKVSNIGLMCVTIFHLMTSAGKREPMEAAFHRASMLEASKQELRRASSSAETQAIDSRLM